MNSIFNLNKNRNASSFVLVVLLVAAAFLSGHYLKAESFQVITIVLLVAASFLLPLFWLLLCEAIMVTYTVVLAVNQNSVSPDAVFFGAFFITALPLVMYAFRSLQERRLQVAKRQQMALATVVAQSDDIIVTKDLNLRVVAANMAFARAAGYSSTLDLLGKTDAEIFRLSEDQEPVKGYMDNERAAQRLSPGEHLITEEPVNFPDGRVGFVLTRKFPIYSNTGELLGTGNISTDITERKKYQETMEKALQQAEAGRRAKEDFLSTMSHEIRTPLNAVIGFTELLFNTDLSPKQLEYAKDANTAGRTLLELINDILQYTRIETGKLQYSPDPTNIRSLAQQIIDICHIQAEKKGLKLVLSVDDRLPSEIIIDPVHINQILLNLVGNAIKFTDQGAVTLELAFVPADPVRSDTKDRLRFCVQDTGIGMSAEVQNRLFAPFMQGDSSVTREYGGTGLGLAISQRLAQQMGAEIKLESSPGEGSCFCFEIELAMQEAERPGKKTDPAEKNRAAKIEQAKADYSEKSILIVEDDRVNMRLAKLLISRRYPGLKIAEAINGQLAVEAALQQAYDCILMDVQMPVMDGYQAARKIRQNENEALSGKKSVPIVALTAGVMDGEEKACRDAGMDDFLSKPIKSEQLFSLLDHLFSQSA